MYLPCSTSDTDARVLFPRQSWVDVREVAVGHVRALQREEAGGERIITSSGPWNWQDFGVYLPTASNLITSRSCSGPVVNAAHKIEPGLPAGNTAYDLKTAVYHTYFDNSKSKRLLDLEYRTIEETTRDSVAQFKEKGWL